jgi:DnaJ-class molecular chaperone
MDLYETLGLKKNASQDEIKSAYREQAKKHHPDKGGDPEQFRQAQIAYDTLSDEQKKSDYDQGKAQASSDPVINFLTSLFLKAISDHEDVDKTDLFKVMQNEIKAKLYSLFQDKQNAKRLIKKLNKVKKRIKKDTKKLFLDLTDLQIRQYEHMISQIELAEQIAQTCMEYLTNCEYEVLVQKALEQAVKNSHQVNSPSG